MINNNNFPKNLYNDEYLFDEEIFDKSFESVEVNFNSTSEESIIINSNKNSNKLLLLKKAFKKALSQRGLDNKIKISYSQKNSNIFINVNQIKTQVVFCDLFSKKVEISFENSQNKINNTQMFLLVKTNEENNIFDFSGVITSEEFISFLNKTKETGDKDKVVLPVDIFEGGIGLLFSYARLLNKNAFKKNEFFLNLYSNIFKRKNIYKIALPSSLVLASTISIIFGNKIFKPTVLATNSLDTRCADTLVSKFTYITFIKIQKSNYINIDELDCSIINKIDKSDYANLKITTGRRDGRIISCMSDDSKNPCKYKIGEFKNIANPALALSEIFPNNSKIEKDYINESSSRLYINILDSLSKNYKKLDSTFLKFKDKLEY